MTIIEKRITAFGRSTSMACDGRCDKAWGINNRPRRRFSDDGDDYVFLGDDDVGIAPAEPGTWEGGETKPSATPISDPELMNKWCFRECERCGWIEAPDVPPLPNMKNPEPNPPRRRAHKESQ